MRHSTRIAWTQFAIATGLAGAVLLMFGPWHPPVGVYVVILAIVGVCVPLIRGEQISVKEKALWTGVMLTLAVLEVTSIYKDRNEHDTAQANIRNEQLQQFNTLVDKQQSLLTSQNNMMTFLINQPKLTEANVRAVVQAYSKPQNPTGVPPASNSELHRDVSEYTAHLRAVEANRDMWYQKFLPETSSGGRRNYEQQQQAVGAWNMAEGEIEREFIDKDLGHGVSLQAELLNRLHEIGPPKPMNALLGVFPEPRGDNGPRGRPFEELANYLDGLASSVPYF